ncbi:hypothetical protein MGG_01075 [Pyricularia oryzae 70-15]|uniref:ABM domain-containing protein n=1 Tax=Pyricularia oryzae (strain 70-15 / ATCC MYA-4617 / FGSC 8958) TaxID=242507 RepID=G4NCI2_PYRO7|nr:uncharacterized protein MGG_01075 [Pyricularia oryzae 70-15]EHA48279.1 hypothetical protein MGG_01075 [Pyricularia oryzae 70-15]
MSTTQEKGQRYSVLVSCTLHDGKTDEYLAIMEKVIAYLSKEEPDFLHIEIMRVDGSPNKLRYLEHWAKPFDVLAKDTASNPQLNEFMNAMDPLLAEKRSVEFLRSFGGPWARTRDGTFSKIRCMLTPPGEASLLSLPGAYS